MVLIQIGLVLLPVIFNFNILTMEKITQILKRKEPHFRYIAPQCSLDEALNRMSCEATDHLAVIDEDRRFIGIITEHDIACRALVSKIPLTSTPVKKNAERVIANCFVGRYGRAVSTKNGAIPCESITCV